jgi:hypothetical protein
MFADQVDAAGRAKDASRAAKSRSETLFDVGNARHEGWHRLDTVG